MNRLGGKKMLAAAPFAAILIALIFTVAMYPMVNMAAKDLPVAVVNEDEGITVPAEVNVGETLVSKFEDMDEENDAVKITVLDDSEEAEKALEEGDYCALIKVPSDFTSNQMQLKSAELEISIDQGHYGMAATLVSTALTSITDTLSDAMRPQVLQKLTAAGVTVTEDQLNCYTDPVSSDIEYVNPIDCCGSGMMSMNGNGLAGMFTWMVTLFSTIPLYFYYRKRKEESLGEPVKKVVTQILWGMVVAAIGAVTVVFCLNKLIGFDIDPVSSGMYAGIAIWCIMMIVLGILRIFDLPGIILCVLAMFLSMGCSYLPYDVLPEFYQTWIYPWAPVRIIAGGYKEVFFISGDWMNHNTVILLCIAAAGIVLSFLALILNRKKKENVQ